MTIELIIIAILGLFLLWATCNTLNLIYANHQLYSYCNKLLLENAKLKLDKEIDNIGRSTSNESKSKVYGYILHNN